jgi:hypothetical protein
MIIPNYPTFRTVFAPAPGEVGADGYLIFPGTSKLRTGGFTGMVTPTISAYPFAITCNAEASDAVLGVHEFDWYLSQRTDVVANQYLTIEHDVPAKSGRVRLNIVNANVAKLLPGLSGAGLLTASSLSTIFRDVHLYVSRRSDRAYQWIRMVAP